ncbi:hypothetical protein ScPMuIL_017552 [Solemya velum]
MGETNEAPIKLDEKLDNRLSTIEEQNKQILIYLEKKNKKKSKGDENEERGNWSNPLDFLLSCLGYAVGLGNVWRFPYLCYRNGGGAFFIPYVIMLVFVGLPIFFLELSLGQFSGSGPFTCWKYAPIFTGIGIGMFAVSAFVSIYYNMIIGWAFYYLFASMRSELPWDRCDPEWASDNCIFNFPKIANCTEKGYDFNMTDGTCRNDTTRMGFFNRTLAGEFGFKQTLPSEEYLEKVVLGSAYSDGIHDLGPLKWELVLCYLLAFVFVTLSLSKSIKSSGKVVYFTATFPYVVLIILFVRGLLLDGYEKGIEFYITPKLETLKNAQVWKDAAVQIFFSLSASWGGLIALSSYNKFNNDCLRDSLIVAIANCATSVFAGFVIFSYLGYLSTIMDVPVEDVAKSGPTLVFAIYPFAVTQMPVAPLWSIIFFVMLITLGVDSEFVLVETVVTSLMDRFPKLRDYKLFTVMTVCSIFFLLGLSLTTQGGSYMLDMMDTYAGGWNILFISFCECISLCLVYGIGRFLMDIETMLGKKICGFFPYAICKYWWAACWCVFTPLLVLFIMGFSWYDYKGMHENDPEHFPPWADALGWLMTLVVIVSILGTPVYMLIVRSGPLGQRLREITSPTRDWGPQLVKHRMRVAEYVPNYDVDPWGKSDIAVKYMSKEPPLPEYPNLAFTSESVSEKF